MNPSASAARGPDRPPGPIAIVSHGRFHAFELAKGFLECGADVRLFTGYPRFLVKKWGFPAERVVSLPVHYCLQHLVPFLPRILQTAVEPFLHRLFGAWAARRLRGTRWAVIRVFSGVAEEILRDPRVSADIRLVVRGSSHVRTQRELAEREERDSGCKGLDKPSHWMVAREEREYALADGIVVLSSFAARTFLQNGVPPGKVHRILNSVAIDRFRATPGAIAARAERLRSIQPLHVLTVGAWSHRKGARLILALAREFRGRCHFRFVGNILPDAASLVAAAAETIEFRPRVPERELEAEYEWGDVFLFPTLEDGWPAVLAQAAAAGLLIITTRNGSGPDVIKEGINGWCVPAFDYAALRDTLLHCLTNREALARSLSHDPPLLSRTWADVARDHLMLREIQTAQSQAKLLP